MAFLLLYSNVASSAGDAPPWWFLASIVVGILALGAFTLRLATKRRKPRGRPCASCGAPVQSGWVRCPVCGAELRAAASQPGFAPARMVAAPRPVSTHSGPPQLEFKSGPLTGQTFLLERDVTTVGAADSNTIVLVDTGVSRKHVGIRKVDGEFELADLGSTNGVFVNGEKSARRKLVNGDLVRIGTSEAVFSG